ncbi:MAG: PEP-CTERM sorting domain-containing protein [Bryobacteraceae bacterium]
MKVELLKLSLLGILTIPCIHASPLDLFLGLPSGTLNLTFDSTNGAALRMNLGNNAGDTLSFRWAHKATDYVPFSDPSWFVVNGGLNALASTNDFGVEVGDYGFTGWQSTNVILNSDNAIFAIGASNTGDTLYNSFVGVDQILLNGSPVFNGGFELGDLSGFATAGDVNVIQDTSIGGCCLTGTTDTILPFAGDFFALIQSFGMEAEGDIELGGAPDNPIVPVINVNPDTGVPEWVFPTIFSGAWTDPPFVYGFNYLLTGGFASSINFPTGPAWSQFAGLNLTSPDCAGIGGTFGNGVGDQTGFDFAAAGCDSVAQWTISTLSPIFDAGDPAGFPLQILLDTGTASLTMTNVTPSAVPEPSSMLLLGAGIGILGLVRARRSRS